MWRAASSDWPEPVRAARGIAAAATPRLCIAFVAQLGDGSADPLAPPREGVALWRPGRSDPTLVPGDFEAVTAPALVAGSAAAVLTFGAHVGGRSSIELSLVGEELVERRPGLPLPRLPEVVTLCSAGDGALWLVWQQRGVIRGARVDEETLAVGEVTTLSPPTGCHTSPSLAWDGRQMWMAWTGGPSGARGRVLLRALPGGPVRALSPVGPARVGAPSLAAAGNGRIWAAWHTDGRPGREADLTRWVEVLSVREGRPKRPRCPRPHARWGDGGEDQSLEFPLLAVGRRSAVTLFARSAHRLRRFDLGSMGWGSPQLVDRQGWGCRGRRPGVARLPDGRLLVAYREGKDVVATVLDGAPASPRPPLVSPSRSVACRVPPRGRLSPARARLGGFEVCFGDIHQHTAHSDGTGTAREAYERARDHYGDDLVALTDHESFLGKRIGPGEWRGLMSQCEAHDEPGRLVTLPGYEWTGRRHPGPGHKCVYLPRTDLPLIGRDHPAAKTSAGLIRTVAGLGGLVFPHHVGWTGADGSAHDPAVQTCWEIVSCHGAYESMDEPAIGQRDVPLEGQFVRDQLDGGLRFGLLGGSDGHGLLWQHGVSRKRDSHRTGLSAVLVRSLCRAEVLEALRQRRCYATSGAKMLLWLDVGGAAMGSEVEVASPVTVSCFAECERPIARAELVRRWGDREHLEPRGTGLRAGTRVAPPTEGAFDYIYLRVEQVDGEVGWSSPVWLLPPGSRRSQ